MTARLPRDHIFQTEFRSYFCQEKPWYLPLQPGPSEWLPQRREAKRRGLLSSPRWWPENILSTFTSTSMECLSKSVPLGHSERSRNLPLGDGNPSCARWHQAPQSRLGQRDEGCSRCGCPDNVMRRNRHQTSSIHWLLIYLSALQKPTTCGWELTADCEIVMKLQVNKRNMVLKDNSIFRRLLLLFSSFNKCIFVYFTVVPFYTSTELCFVG